MGNRVGIIFHNNWDDFSPLLYSHNGGYQITKEFIEEFLNSYRELYPVCDDGHKYDCEHVMYQFIQSVGVDLHNRICSLSESEVHALSSDYWYRNYFESGCFLVNVDFNNFGEIFRS